MTARVRTEQKSSLTVGDLLRMWKSLLRRQSRATVWPFAQTACTAGTDDASKPAHMLLLRHYLKGRHSIPISGVMWVAATHGQ